MHRIKNLYKMICEKGREKIHLVPRERWAHSYMSLFQWSRFAFYLESFYLVLGIPSILFVNNQLYQPSSKLNRIEGVYILVSVLVFLVILLTNLNKKVIQIFFVLYSFSLWPTIIYLKPSQDLISNLIYRTFVTLALLLLTFAILASVYSLIQRAVNHDFYEDSHNENQKIFSKTSIWRNYEKFEKELVPTPVNQKVPKHSKYNYKLIPVNRNAYIANKAQLPTELVEHAKLLDLKGIYSLPTLSLQTGKPFNYSFQVNIKYGCKSRVLTKHNCNAETK